MTENDVLAQRFEADRARLRGVAYRLLGSLSEADDAVQEAWLRLQRSDADAVENLGGWLTTVVARVALDMLRSRGTRREQPLEGEDATAPAGPHAPDPEQEALLALLDPDVVLRVDRPLLPPRAPVELRGAATVARAQLEASRGARAARAALVDGLPGIVVAPQGRLLLAIRFELASDGRIAAIDATADRERLARLELALLD